MMKIKDIVTIGFCVFSGAFVVHLLIETFLNYPPKIMGISP